MRFAQEDCLAKGWHVKEVSSRAIVVVVEAVAAIENVAGIQVVIAAKVDVFLSHEIEAVERSGNNARDRANFDVGAERVAAERINNILRGDIAGRWIARGNSESSKLAQSSHCICAIASREAACQCGKSSWCWGERSGAVQGACRDNLLIKTAKEKCSVFNDWTANCKAAKFVVGARWLGKSVRILSSGHAVENGVVLIHVTGPMPRVGAALGDQVDHGAGIASIFRAKVVGDDDVLTHKF